MQSRSLRSRMFKMDRRFLWLGLGLLTWLVRLLLGANPYFTEVVYSRGLFAAFRYLWDFTLGWMPFPLLYLAVPLLLGWLGYGIVKGIRKKSGRSWPHKIGRFLLNVAAAAAAVYTLFFWMWGFNYFRRPVADQLGLRMEKMDEPMLRQAFSEATDNLLLAYANRPADTTMALAMEALPEDLETSLRTRLEALLGEADYPASGRVRGRRLFPAGFLFRLSASGIYIPFVAEGHVDAAIPAASLPFTLAHEMGHGYGFGEEGVCNFWGVLTCITHEHPAIQYVGRLAYWRYVASAFRRTFPEEYAEFRPTLPSGILADLEALKAAYARYPSLFPHFSSRVYDAYLKNQGIKEGIASYDQVVDLIRALAKVQASEKPIFSESEPAL